MKPEEAKETIEYARAFNKENTPLMKALDLAVNALEKQIPKKPTASSDGDADGYPVWDYYCPSCGYYFDEDEPDYCPKCGQAIDWSDYE